MRSNRLSLNTSRPKHHQPLVTDKCKIQSRAERRIMRRCGARTEFFQTSPMSSASSIPASLTIAVPTTRISQLELSDHSYSAQRQQAIIGMKQTKETNGMSSASSSSSSVLEQDEVPEAKKPRLEKRAEYLPPEFFFCRMLLDTTADEPIPRIPTTLLRGGPTRNDLTQLRKLMENHEFRTSVVASPRPALSIYKDSCAVIDSDSDNNREEGIIKGKTFVIAMLGLHPHQEQLEHFYSTGIKNVYCLLLFCQRLRLACANAFQNKTGPVEQFVLELENECRAAGSNIGITIHDSRRLSCVVQNRVASLIPMIVQAEPRNRIEQLQHEYDRIVLCNSTLSNALVHLFSTAQGCTIKDIYFKRSNVTTYERITLYLYDPDVDLVKPPQFIFLPSLKVALEEGHTAIVRKMIESFWHHLLRRGYFASLTMKQALTPGLEKFFLSGITNDEAIPLQLYVSDHTKQRQMGYINLFCSIILFRIITTEMHTSARLLLCRFTCMASLAQESRPLRGT
jgi:hypothetical protein